LFIFGGGEVSHVERLRSVGRNFDDAPTSLLRRIVSIEPVKIGSAVFAVLAITFQAVAFSGTSIFYDRFKVSPEEVGFSYADLLGRKSLQIAATSLIIMFIMVNLILLAGLALVAIKTTFVDQMVEISTSLMAHLRNAAVPAPVQGVLRGRYYPTWRLALFAVALALLAHLSNAWSHLVLWVVFLLMLNSIVPTVSEFEYRAGSEAKERVRRFYYRWPLRFGFLVLLLACLLACTAGLDSLVRVAGIPDMVTRVYAGRSLPHEIFTINPLRIAAPRADLVRVRWVGADPPELFAAADGGRKAVDLILFGQANGTTVLFNPVDKLTLRFPSANLAILSSVK
jgi:hypothetical protein